MYDGDIFIGNLEVGIYFIHFFSLGVSLEFFPLLYGFVKENIIQMHGITILTRHRPAYIHDGS